VLVVWNLSTDRGKMARFDGESSKSVARFHQ